MEAAGKYQATGPVTTEWKLLIDGYNKNHLHFCPYCEAYSAYTMTRYITEKEGGTEKQYRVECPRCKNVGKTYYHENLAVKSWEVRENNPPKIVFKHGKWIDESVPAHLSRY